jgi:plasmid stability protein
MARLTVRNLDDSTIQWLRERGAARGVSMEQEARDILAAYVGLPTTEGFNYNGLVFDDDEAEVVKAGQTKTRS